jgi:two-component sensor histidine kinase
LQRALDHSRRRDHGDGLRGGQRPDHAGPADRLIVNEFVTNAKKHGSGPIVVTFGFGAAGQYELCVLDEGARLPAGSTIDRSGGHGIGMKVVVALVGQLAGHLSTYGNPAGGGTCVSVVFPAAPH